MEPTVYNTLLWRASSRPRALERDGNRCTVSRLLGGRCTEGTPLHVHHIVPVEEGGDPYDLDNLGTTCAAHHPMWEALRRLLLRHLLEPEEERWRCPHRHASTEAREQCERRRRRQVERRERLAA